MPEADASAVPDEPVIDIALPETMGFLLEPHRYKVAFGGRGGVKCLATGTRVIMADGSLRAIETIAVGEQVMGPDSRPRTVLALSRGHGPLYRVRQTSGMEYVVNEAHILSLKEAHSGDIVSVGVTVAAQQNSQWLAGFRGYRVKKNQDVLLSQITIDRVADGEFAGFSLDGDHLFLLEDGTVTHNSWSFARALLTLGMHKPLRMLCAREVMRTIKDSVHKLLSDQIQLLNMGTFYNVTQAEIRGLNGSNFIFTGLSDQTAESIKSFEGVDICWVEEAQKVSGRSWSILMPTIRKPGSEVWVSFNPELDTDETYVRFVLVPPPGAVVVQTSYRDNPWLSGELEAERMHDEITKPKDEYNWIWEGKCLPAIHGAIYAREMSDMVTQGRIVSLPYDPKLRVHTVWDLGWNDRMVVGFWQRGFADCRLIDYIEVQYKRVDEVVGMYNSRPWNWGYDWLPHDGFTHDPKSGTTVAKILQKFGRTVKPVPNISEELGIKHARQFLMKVYVEKDKGARFIECLKRFRRHIPKHGEPAHPVSDEFAHGADMARYAALVAEKFSNAQEDKSYPVIDPFSPRIGSMGHLGALLLPLLILGGLS